MTIRVKTEISLVNVTVINLYSFIIFAVSGKLVFSQEIDFLVNDSVVEELHYNTPNDAILNQNYVRMPLPTTLQSRHNVVTTHGKYLRNTVLCVLKILLSFLYANEYILKFKYYQAHEEKSKKLETTLEIIGLLGQYGVHAPRNVC